MASLITTAVMGLLLAACAAPTAAPRSALEYFLTDVQAHSVVFAYTLLTNSAESRTPFLPFFNWVKGSDARFRIVKVKMVTSDEAIATVAVNAPGSGTRYVQIQMLEEGNAGDWLLNAPFATQGGSAIQLFR